MPCAVVDLFLHVVWQLGEVFMGLPVLSDQII